MCFLALISIVYLLFHNLCLKKILSFTWCIIPELLIYASYSLYHLYTDENRKSDLESARMASKAFFFFSEADKTNKTDDICFKCENNFKFKNKSNRRHKKAEIEVTGTGLARGPNQARPTPLDERWFFQWAGPANERLFFQRAGPADERWFFQQV